MTVSLHLGDCVEWLRSYDGPLFDSCVTDPPYHLTSIVKRFGGANAAEAKVGATGAYARAARGFMGKEWDGGDVAFRPETWRAVFDCLKPGAHLVAFSGTRTYHRMACAIEDAGFEIRDQLQWLYGAGFPKSHNVDKKLGDDERCNCAKSEALSERDLRLLCESDVSASVNTGNECREILLAGLSQQGSSGAVLRAKPAQSATDGTQPGLEGWGDVEADARELSRGQVSESACLGATDGAGGRLCDAAPARDGRDVRLFADADGGGQSHRPQPGKQPPEQPRTLANERGSQAGGSRSVCARCGKPDIPRGLGTALKPAAEPICLARKPLAEKSVAANVLAHGTGAINVDGCRVMHNEDCRIMAPSQANIANPSEKYRQAGRRAEVLELKPEGRWPANVIHDGSEAVVGGFPETESGAGNKNTGNRDGSPSIGGGLGAGIGSGMGGDSGSAARFFYSAKAGPLDRIGTKHATVKPVDLMRWLCRLITPPGGHILEPFAGSGTTGIAAMAEGFDCTMIELEAEHFADIERKLAYLRGEGRTRFVEHDRKAAHGETVADHGPLFGSAAA